jgi:hypothetical protein
MACAWGECSMTGTNSPGDTAPQIRVVPAQQRLRADTPPRGQIDPRLEHEAQLVAGEQSRPEIPQQAVSAPIGGIGHG